MRYPSIIRADENQGPPPQAPMDAMEPFIAESLKNGARAFMQLHLDHWPEWEGECEVRELVFLAP